MKRAQATGRRRVQAVWDRSLSLLLPLLLTAMHTPTSTTGAGTPPSCPAPTHMHRGIAHLSAAAWCTSNAGALACLKNAKREGVGSKRRAPIPSRGRFTQRLPWMSHAERLPSTMEENVITKCLATNARKGLMRSTLRST
jgi:hypothetical protein